MRIRNLKRAIIAASLLLGLGLGFLGVLVTDRQPPSAAAPNYHLARGGVLVTDIAPGTAQASVIWGD